ncbi:MAG: ketoacyl-ACP synthase III [Muribaculaceae bacterium]|nr:ketoacyl-ACP synthase III [Muribaculaceae bacterium]
MAFLNVNNVSIKGFSACVPSQKDSTAEIYKWEGASSFIESTGIAARRRVNDSTTSSDLCASAAEKLISELGWDKSEIEVLIFVSQTPDYDLPATSCLLQERIGLSKECYTLDISLGCSGWVYALSVIVSLMQNGAIKKGILIAGDTPTKLCSPDDKSVWPLFGDAGTATAIEYTPNGKGMQFTFNTDGKGAETIIVREGGYRNPYNSKSLVPTDYGEEKIRNGVQVELDGMDVFSFGITKAPKSVKLLCEHFEIDKDSIDLFSFHQANKMMNEMIRKKLKIDEEKVPYCMDEFGNTSCASIPLVLVTREREKLMNQKLTHIACGFGVGLSWGSVYFETDKITVPELIEI